MDVALYNLSLPALISCCCRDLEAWRQEINAIEEQGYFSFYSNRIFDEMDKDVSLILRHKQPLNHRVLLDCYLLQKLM